MKSKAIMTAGIILWATLLMASRVDAAEEPVIITEEVRFWSERYGKEYGISPELIQAVVWTESRCIPSAQSPDKSCKGLMQVKPSAHQDRMARLGVRNIFGVWENLKVGTDYLAEISETEPDIGVALMIYNGASPEKVEAGRNGKLSGYAKQILEIASELEARNGK